VALFALYPELMGSVTECC